MARARMLAKSISVSQQVHDLNNEFYQLCYSWIIPHLDDFGRMPGEAGTVKALVMPRSKRSENDFQEALHAMVRVGLIKIYEVEGSLYIISPTFDDHQSGLHKRTVSRYPDPSSGKFLEVPGNSHLREGKGREGKGVVKPPTNGTIHLTDEQRTSFAAAFPQVDLDEERKKAEAWLHANPDKPKKRPVAFFRNWLNNAKPKAKGVMEWVK